MLLTEEEAKICTKCLEEKLLSDFYRQNSTKDGREYYCISCVKKYRKKYRQTNRERIRAYDRDYKRTSKALEYRAEQSRLYRERNPQKKIAHYLVREALKKGDLLRPEFCEKCKKGNCKIEAHHKDYTKPLSVLWLCVPCHSVWS